MILTTRFQLSKDFRKKSRLSIDFKHFITKLVYNDEAPVIKVQNNVRLNFMKVKDIFEA